MKRSGQPRTDAGERPRRRLLRRLAAAAGLVLVLGLSFQLGRVEVTPLTIASSRADAVTKARALELWNQAMALSNAFLSSDFNRSLPPGQLELDEERGMAFTSGGERLPVRVWCSMLGRVAVWSGAVAQECEGGFRVGPRGGPVRSVDHSWFRTRSGAFRSADLVARTLLHELGHALHRVGNFGVARSLVNYGEIVFLWRGGPSAPSSGRRWPSRTSSRTGG